MISRHRKDDKRIKFKIKYISLAVLFSASLAQASTITLDANARGWYTESGRTNGNSAGNNYIAGDCSGPVCGGITTDYRNWFVFDLSSVGVATSATLRLEVPSNNGFASTNDAFETYTLFDVDTGASDLGTSDDISVWTDLGEGAVFGSYDVFTSDLGSFVEITLNSIGLATLNLNAGFDFALGGSITTLDQALNDEYAFGYTFSSFSTQLVIETAEVNSPSSIALFLVSLCGFMYARKSINKK